MSNVKHSVLSVKTALHLSNGKLEMTFPMISDVSSRSLDSVATLLWRNADISATNKDSLTELSRNRIAFSSSSFPFHRE